MLSHAPQEPSRTSLLRNAVTRLRDRTPHADAEVATTEVGAERKFVPTAGVALILPFDGERRLIPRLLRRMRWGRFLRYCPDRLDEYAALTSYAADYFMQRLRTARIDSWRECVVSIWAIGRLTRTDPARAEAETHLYRLLGPKGASIAAIDEKRLGSHWKLVFNGLFWTLSLGSSAYMLTAQLLGRGSYTPVDWLLMLILAVEIAVFLSLPVTFLAFVVGFPLDRRRLNRIRAMAILTLGRWREPRHLDLILREYAEKRGRVRLAAEVALRELLPLLEAEDATEYAMDFVPNLCRALQRKERQFLDYTPQEERMESLLLETLGKVGDGRAIPTVARIAQRGRTLPLQKLAGSILPILQARSRQATDPRQLLRGAVPPDSASSTLLRPAHDTATPAEQLLRPHTPD